MKGYDDLILRVDFGSDGPDPIWRAGRRRNTAGAELRGGGSPEFTKSGAPGVASTRAGVGCVQRVACDAPGPKPGTAGLCSPGMAAAAALRGGARRRDVCGLRLCCVVAQRDQEGSTKQTQDNAAHAGRCGAAEAWPWRSGGGGSPAAVLRQPSGPRPKFLGEKGGTGLQGAHLGVGSKEGPAQRGRRREPAAKTTRSPGRSRCGRRGRRRKVRGGSWR